MFINTIVKTERSHEENQERAYIAASRRADRSIEARVQSARQASEIHRKRTGKGFKITEEIVIKEEMYEEEDDDLPRSIHLLNAHMQTSSIDLNSRLESYLSNKVAFSNALARSNMAWRSNEINRAFAESFPNAMPQVPQNGPQQSQPQPQNGPQQHQNMHHQHQNVPQQFNMPNQAMYHQSPEDCSPTTAYSPTTYSPTAYSPTPYSPGMPPTMCGAALMDSPRAHLTGASILPSRRDQTRRRQSRASPRASVSTPSSAPPAGKRRKSNKSLPTPVHASGSAASTPNTPISDNAVTPESIMPSIETIRPTGSAFTTELPAETRMLLEGIGADDVISQTLANQDGFYNQGQFQQNWVDPTHFMCQASMPRTMDQVDPALVPDLYGNGTNYGMASRCAMPTTAATFAPDAPASADDESWKAFIDDSMWPIDQQ